MNRQLKVFLVIILVVICLSALAVVLTSCSLLEGLLNSHKHEYEETVVEATCEEKGYTLKKCECGDEKKVNEVAALGHEYKDVYTIDKNATCTEAGSKSRHCIRCSDKIDVQSISALGHNYATTYTVDVRATCEVNGSESKHCSRCSSTIEPRPIAALGHDYAETKTTDINATCTTDGLKSRHCSRCSSTIDAEIILRLGHNYSPTVTLDKEATCTEDGQRSRHCSRCSSVIDVESIEKLGHDIISHKTVAPTCTEQGYEQYNCSRCEGYKENIVAALGHQFEKGKCTICSYSDPSYYSLTRFEEEPYVWYSGSVRFGFELSSNIINAIRTSPDKELTVTIEFEMMYNGAHGPTIYPLYDGWCLDRETPYLTVQESGGDKFYFNGLEKIGFATTTYRKASCTIKIPAKQIVENKVYLNIVLPLTARQPDWYIKNITLSMGFEA